MAILLNNENRVAIQGITGRSAARHAVLMKNYGTNLVGGVSPGKKGTAIEGIPVFDTVEDVVETTGADTIVSFLPPMAAKDGIVESIDAGITTIISVTEGIPIQDLLVIKRRITESGTRLIGPTSPGLISPGCIKAGFLPENVCFPGPIGVITKSGTLSYEITSRLTEAGLGQSTWVGIGADRLKGLSFVDLVSLFEKDEQTKLIVIIGEIGGEEEEDLATYLLTHPVKPVVAFVAGKGAPKGVQMGHAGAIVMGGTGSYESKVAALEAAQIKVASTIQEVVTICRRYLP